MAAPELTRKSDKYDVIQLVGYRQAIVRKNTRRPIFDTDFPANTIFRFYGEAIIGEAQYSDGKTCYVAGMSEETGRKEVIICADYELLNNGNVLIRFNNQRKDRIFSPSEGKMVDYDFDVIPDKTGTFTYDPKTNIPYALVQYNALDMESNTILYTLYGKIGVTGRLISDLCDSRDGKIWEIKREGFDFHQEIRKASEMAKRKRKSIIDTINNLPIHQ